jgi:hypothetical protein
MEQQRPDAVLVSGEGLPTILQAFFFTCFIKGLRII